MNAAILHAAESIHRYTAQESLNYFKKVRDSSPYLLLFLAQSRHVGAVNFVGERNQFALGFQLKP